LEKLTALSRLRSWTEGREGKGKGGKREGREGKRRGGRGKEKEMERRDRRDGKEVG